MHAPQVNIALRAARQAGNLIRRAAENNDPLSVDRKGVNDFVTQVDRAAEARIVDVLRKAYPEHGILAEEGGEIAGQGDGADYQWVIDPLDGTTNFIHGVPQYAVSIALKIKGKVEHAVVYDPLRDEEFTASRGRGAALNGRRLRVTNRPGLEGALIGTGFPFRQDQAQHMDAYLGMFRSVAEVAAGLRRPGAAALDLAWVAAGRFDGFFEIGLAEWDMAAGILLITEAGGLVGDLNGGHRYLTQGNLVAGSPKVFKGLLQKLQPHVTDALKR
ncbi:inositol-1-monophosphatase [Alloalcanivorax mobilis]|uniref:inositol-1-monophosphatase n=1 Tax=Alloalcanivorax mobilis TaxID=2019569 RepID=UPI000B5B3288|nr:inositol-1-monophosphatase [Alloalcanivorax mobilis]ASK34992.1 inositol monophosphatase [Alcanivorax sp. N3-2A]|tara:strand:+ start:2061 stop:2879 length:819 start_codon:yes stop_codon:yes gene_type:complete